MGYHAGRSRRAGRMIARAEAFRDACERELDATQHGERG
jgi:hypothetical protein